MLTEREMDRIRFEEIYRDEIRKKINNVEEISFASKSWKFINSSFGIWLLSTVVVGLIVYAYNSNKLQAELNANNAAALHRLETEVSNRLQQFKMSLTDQDPATLYYEKEELAYMLDGELVGDGSFSQKKPVYIFSEYRERTMNSLLYEMERLVNDKELSKSINKARTILGQMQSRFLKTEDPPQRTFSLDQRIQQLAQMGNSVISPEDQKAIEDYEANEKLYKDGPLAEYHTKIKGDLNQFIVLFESNSFLKEMSDQ